MARTRLFARVARALGDARRQQGYAPHPRAITRRQALALAAAGLASACASARSASPSESIGVVGAGAAGLTIAYRLAEAGRRPAVYESSGRIGGRMYTRRNFTAEGQFCELGGELVDTGHESLRALAAELGVGIQRLAPEGGEEGDLYDVGGRLRTPRDMLDPEAGTGAFLAVAAIIAADQEALYTEDDEWTERARALDAMSLKDYLDALRGQAEGWAVDVLDLAYLGEFGLPTAEQSALNMVDFIGAETDEHFAIFGESDEAWRVEGGSSSLIEGLSNAIGARADVHVRRELIRIADDGMRIALTFRTPDGEATETHDRVVLALPFTRLRHVEGIETLGLTPEKRAAVMELGYGANAKLMVATTSRPWREPSTGAPQLAGALVSDRGMQTVWETSRGQEGQGGVLTNFLAGPPADGEEAAALATLTRGLRALSPRLADALDPETRAAFFWNRHPHTLGSYATARPGQYTTLLEVAGTPELGGRLHFAGEHTSAAFLGYMNGAVESGERVAAEILVA
jgi:monoamine oxidase